MATISFYLNNKDNDGNKQIMLRVSHRGEPTAFYLGERIPDNIWEKKNQCVSEKYKGHRELNRNIQARKTDMEKIIRDLDYEFPDSTYTLKHIRERFEPMIRTVKLSVNNIGLRSKLLEFISSRSDLKGGTKATYSTLANKHLAAYETSVGKTLNILDVDQNFYESFQNFLWSKQNLTNNTVHKHVTRLQAFLTWMKEKGEQVSDSYNKFTVKETDKEVIFLSEEEWKKLAVFKTSDGLQPSMDLFVFSCVTGMRYSDISNFNPDTDVRDNFILIQSQVKTQNYSGIPINKYSKAILEKYDYILPSLSASTLNENIKKIAAYAGLNRQERRIRYKAAERKEEILPLSQLLTFHAGRSTFIMAHLSKGIAAEAIMSMTGHKDYRSFSRYVKFSKSLLRKISDEVYEN